MWLLWIGLGIALLAALTGLFVLADHLGERRAARRGAFAEPGESQYSDEPSRAWLKQGPL